MPEKVLNRICPICNSSSGELIHNQSFVTFKESPLPRNYDIVSCTNCGFVFADTSASQEDYNTYYSILSKYEDADISSGSAFNQNDYDRMVRTADALEKYVEIGDAILDLGCANGGLLKVLKERGFKNLTGIDPSRICVNNVKSAGIEAVQTHIFEQFFIDWDKKFDLVILSHVAEHIRDLGTAVKIAKSKLTHKGIIYIEVPDATMYDKFFVVPYYFIDSEHINHFSGKSLDNLMQQYGFRNIYTCQGQYKITENIDYPYFYSLFDLKENVNSKVLFDDSVIHSFKSFLKQSEEDKNVNTIIQNLIKTQEEVVVWGAGQYALRLLASSRLSEVNIIGFVDSDRSKQNKIISSYNVFPPDFIVDKSATLLIISALYSDKIVKTALELNKDIKYIVLI
jgi:SAM-dependent methyltransferase